MSENSPRSSSKPFLFAVTAILVVAAIAFGVSRWVGASSKGEISKNPDDGPPSSKSPARYSGSTPSGTRHGGKAGEKSEEERIAGKPARVRRESPKQVVERITMEAEEDLRLLRQRARRSRAKPDDQEREKHLTLLLRGQDHWRMTEEISKNPSLRAEAQALNRRLAKWMEKSGDMDLEALESGFRELRSALGQLRSKHGASSRRSINRSRLPARR